MTDQIPETPVEPARQSLMQRVSIVWVVPIAALLIALGIAWHAYQSRGALIEISFTKASGIAAQQTELRFREVSVGVVEKVEFSDDLTRVIASVRVDKDVEPYLDSSAVFWVVQPEVSTRGVSGLQTVLSGVYIEGSWDSVPEGLKRQFVGLEEAPVATPDQKGTRIVLSSNTGKGLTEGTPILFKGLEVGRVGKPTLSDDGVTITAPGFVDAPHDTLLTTTSRFWDASGISFNLGTGGVSVDVESFASLITGGISFETMVSGGDPVAADQVFAVFANQEGARQSLFDGTGPEGGTLEIAMIFEQNVTGLNIGAPVLLRGLEIGKVVGITGKVDAEQFGDDRVRLVVALSLNLDKIRAAPEGEGLKEQREAILDFFAESVADGWRARLARGSLLSGALRIEMVQVPDAAPATFVRDAEPYPIFPSVESDLQGVNASAEGLLKRVSDLPIEDLLNSAKTFLDNAAALVASEDIHAIPGEVRGVVQDVRGVIGTADFQALPERLTGIADDVLAVLDDVKARDGVAKLVEAIGTVSDVAGEFGTALDGVPGLVERIDAVAAKAEALDIEALLARATGLAEDVGAILGTEAAKALPDRLVTALDGVDAAVAEATAMLAEVNDAGAATALTGALDNINAAAADVGTAVEGLPDLIDQIKAVAAKAEAVDLDTLAAQLTGLIESAEALIGTDAARALPESLKVALDEVGAALDELRAGGTVENVNAALESTRTAAEAVASASADLPALVERTEAVLREAEQALTTLSDTGQLNREAQNTLREVSRAADSVRSLARTLERKPNALLTGR